MSCSSNVYMKHLMGTIEIDLYEHTDHIVTGYRSNNLLKGKNCGRETHSTQKIYRQSVRSRTDNFFKRKKKCGSDRSYSSTYELQLCVYVVHNKKKK